MIMTALEAAAQLRTTSPLAQWLLTKPLSSAIFPDEAEILTNFLAVLEAGYGDNSQVFEMSGLNWREYTVLLTRLDYHLTRIPDNL